MLKIAEITIETFYILSAMYIFMFKILKVSFSKKTVSNILRSVWILKSENGFCFSLLNRSIQDDLDHGASKRIKGTEESLPRVDSPVPLTRHYPRDLGLICFEKKNEKSVFGFKNPILDFPFSVENGQLVQAWKILVSLSSKWTSNSN